MRHLRYRRADANGDLWQHGWNRVRSTYGYHSGKYGTFRIETSGIADLCVCRQGGFGLYASYRGVAGQLHTGNAADGSKNLTLEKITHVVASGENIYTIANRYGVTPKDIRKWNGLGSNRVA